MTGYTVHSGTTIKFSESWDRIFQERSKKSVQIENAVAKKSVAKKSAGGTAKAKARSNAETELVTATYELTGPVGFLRPVNLAARV
jgi:hypothetical protein